MLTKETDGEFSPSLEMRTLEKEKDSSNLLFHSYSEDLDPNSETVSFSSSEVNNHGSSPVSGIVSSNPPRKNRSDSEDFLNSENEKSDYDWLLSAPLFPSMDTESQKIVTNKNDLLNSRSTALKPRLVNIQEESDQMSNMATKHPNLQSGQLNSSDGGNKKPSSKGSSVTASRSATPTARPTLTKSTNPSRSAMPTTLPSTKAMAPSVRSSTPSKTTARSSTPVARSSVSAAKKTPRSATPNRCPSKPAGPSIASGPAGRSSSTSKFNSRSCSNPRALRANQSLPERPASASKGSPGAAKDKSSSHASRTRSNGKTRQKSRSPSRRLISNGTSAKIFPLKQKLRSAEDNEVSPVVMGTKMVERVVNMRKLAPPKQDDLRAAHGDTASKSCADSSGFGRTLSSKSLDMALRHMDITRSILGKLQPLATKSQTSSIDSVVSSKSVKVGAIGVSDSPGTTTTSSNGSSNSIRFDEFKGR